MFLKASVLPRVGILAACITVGSVATGQQYDWLASRSTELTPKIVSTAGLGTSHAVAEARVTRKDAEAWCASQQLGGNLESCIREQLGGASARTYRATADCRAGRITTIDGDSYTLAGVWDASDVGAGRTKWRDGNGKIVGRDTASGGLAISQNWEILCPRGIPASARSAGAVPPSAPKPTRPVTQAPSVCAGQPHCDEVSSFAARITDFRSSASARWRIVSANMRFQNKSDRPLILTYVSGSGTATDDRGNRYIANENDVRGIGVVRGRNVDPKFVLQPGASSDARFEFAWSPTGGDIYGTSFELDLAVREVKAIGNAQYQLGAEYPLHFKGLGKQEPYTGTPAGGVTPTDTPVAVSPATVEATPSPVTSPLPDACAGRPRCYSAGLFTAEVAQVIANNPAPRQNHVLRLNIKFQNVSSQPIILAYKAGSSLAIDNQGNRFYWGTAGTNDTSVQGMGIVTGRSANPQFALQPGESRHATFQLFRRPDRNVIGTSYNYDVSIVQLETLDNGQQVRTVREYSLAFPNLRASTGGASQTGESVGESVKKLTDLFKKKKN